MSVKAKDIIPPALSQHLAALGYNLRLARKRRKWSVAKVRGDIKCSKGTLEDAEKGRPTVSIGVYVLLMDLYGFKADFAALTAPDKDTIGQALAGERGTSHRPKVSPADF